MTTAMAQMLDSMEHAMKLQNQARTQRRAQKAEEEKKAFQEKLARAATNDLELNGMATRVKGAEDAVQRDQLMGLMMAGF